MQADTDFSFLVVYTLAKPVRGPTAPPFGRLFWKSRTHCVLVLPIVGSASPAPFLPCGPMLAPFCARSQGARGRAFRSPPGAGPRLSLSSWLRGDHL